MPGAPHMRGGAPLDERSTFNIVKMFIVLPVLAGVGLAIVVVWNAAKHGADFTFVDWLFQVGWGSCMAFGLIVGLPAVGVTELRRRRRERDRKAREQAANEPKPG
jgi:hypothetical protein